LHSWEVSSHVYPAAERFVNSSLVLPVCQYFSVPSGSQSLALRASNQIISSVAVFTASWKLRVMKWRYSLSLKTIRRQQLSWELQCCSLHHSSCRLLTVVHSFSACSLQAVL